MTRTVFANPGKKRWLWELSAAMDLGTVIALGVLFAPLNAKTVVFIVVCGATLFLLPRMTSWFFKRFSRDHHYLKRLRTLTLGFLTPFYFIRAGSYVSIPALIAAPMAFFVLFSGKVSTKIFGLLPVVRRFRPHSKERWYYTLLMSTGLTFGSISAMFGLTHGIISRGQYSHLVAVVIGSAVIPTLIANAVFLPKHLLQQEAEGLPPDIGTPKKPLAK